MSGQTLQVKTENLLYYGSEGVYGKFRQLPRNHICQNHGLMEPDILVDLPIRWSYLKDSIEEPARSKLATTLIRVATC